MNDPAIVCWFKHHRLVDKYPSIPSYITPSPGKLPSFGRLQRTLTYPRSPPYLPQEGHTKHGSAVSTSPSPGGHREVRWNCWGPKNPVMWLVAMPEPKAASNRLQLSGERSQSSVFIILNKTYTAVVTIDIISMMSSGKYFPNKKMCVLVESCGLKFANKDWLFGETTWVTVSNMISWTRV